MGFPALLQTPVARTPVEGSLGIGFSRIAPYDTLYLSFSPFDWLNVSARYTDTNVVATPTNTLHDKGFNVHLRLLQESAWVPETALGLADIGGTGLFSGEYLAFGKRLYDWELSLGLGWGRLGAASDFSNPLAELDERFRQRKGGIRGQGGLPSSTDWFSGDSVAVFAGLRYQRAGWPWAFLLELEGNDYSQEICRDETVRADPRFLSGEEICRDDELRSASRVNAGIEYFFRSGASFRLAYERGDTLGFVVSFRPDFNQRRRSEARLRQPPAPVAPPRHRLPDAPVQVESEEERLRSFHQALRQQRIFVTALDLDDSEKLLRAEFAQGLSDETSIAYGRLARTALNFYPQRFDRVQLTELAAGQPVMTVELSLEGFTAAAKGEVTPEELAMTLKVQPPLQDKPTARFSHPWLARYPAHAYGLTPALRSNIGGPDAFYAGQLLLKPFVSLQISPNLHLGTAWAFDSGLNNLDQIRPREVPTRLAPVRTELERYQRESSGSYLDRLHVDYIDTLSPNLYWRLSAGIFEEMYGGIAHELLYKPHDARWAIGYNVNRVRKRDYNQRLEFLDFETTTGHLNLFHVAPRSGLRTHLSFGRYLAGDVGATLDLSKVFRNGFRVGAFATKTNVSSEDFGEGSFDKGLYLFIPIDLLSSVRGVGGLGVQYRFITRDGGAKVGDGRSLYSAFERHGAGPLYGAPTGLLE